MLKRTLKQNYGNNNEENFHIDDTTLLNGKSITNLKYKDINLTNNFSAIHDFSKLTDAEATIFVKENNEEYTRISTSLKDTNHKRLVGTKINASHPAYAFMQQKQDFYGRVTLFNKKYISIYSPISNKNNEIIGILFVAYPIERIYSIILGYNQQKNNLGFYENLPESGIIDFKYQNKECRHL